MVPRADDTPIVRVWVGERVPHQLPYVWTIVQRCAQSNEGCGPALTQGQAQLTRACQPTCERKHLARGRAAMHYTGGQPLQIGEAVQRAGGVLATGAVIVQF